MNFPFKVKYRDSYFHRILSAYAEMKSDFSFVQIGANDGITTDPIHRYVTKLHWKGVLVEPVRYLYEKLLVTYKENENVFFENVAICV